MPGRVSAAHSPTRISFADTPSRSRGAFRPSFASSLHPPNPRGRREGRVPAGTRGPLRENAHAGRTAQQHTGVADHSAFPAQWLDGLCRDLPGADHSFWPPSPFELTMPSARLGWRTSPNGLTVATTARTTRFCRTHGPPCRRSIPGPVDGAGNLRARRSLTAPSSARGLGLTGTTRPARASRADAAASTASPARDRDDFTSPLLGEPGWATHTSKPNFGKAEYFRAHGLTEADTGNGQ